jgi:putative oxidoreductase
MGITARIQRWNLTHPSFLLLFIRIVLGMILLAKGIFFISHAQHLKELILESRFAPGVGFLTAYTTFAHLFGGVFIIIGLLTRLAVILQIPVLLGALFFILPEQGLNDGGSDLILSLVVFIFLLIILFKGSGTISMDDYLKKHLL